MPGCWSLTRASMLDLPIVYSILRAVGPSKRLLFVGDPAQLPPIGPGPVLHRMTGSPGHLQKTEAIVTPNPGWPQAPEAGSDQRRALRWPAARSPGRLAGKSQGYRGHSQAGPLALTADLYSL